MFWFLRMMLQKLGQFHCHFLFLFLFFFFFFWQPSVPTCQAWQVLKSFHSQIKRTSKPNAKSRCRFFHSFFRNFTGICKYEMFVILTFQVFAGRTFIVEPEYLSPNFLTLLYLATRDHTTGGRLNILSIIIFHSSRR